MSDKNYAIYQDNHPEIEENLNIESNDYSLKDLPRMVCDYT
jgi:hypothetical protein